MTSKLQMRFPSLSLRRRLAACLLPVALASGAVGAAPRKAPGTPAPKSATAGAKTPAPTAKAPLVDTAAVRAYYLDGDFEPAIQLIEASLRTKAGFSHDDSVFMFKHLGVMYAAKYETREKGKHYMHRLLDVEPTARILDMYASDMIYMIFKNIQDEFEASRRRLVRADSALGGGRGTEPKDDRPRPEPAARKSSGYVWLGASAAVAIAAGAATWYYFSDEPKTSSQNHAP